MLEDFLHFLGTCLCCVVGTLAVAVILNQCSEAEDEYMLPVSGATPDDMASLYEFSENTLPPTFCNE